MTKTQETAKTGDGRWQRLLRARPSAPAASTRTGSRRHRPGLRADQRGSAAVEFGFVVIPFCGLLFGIMGQCLNFYYQQVLDTAVSDAARLITTGQAQASGLTAAQFKLQVCSRLNAMFDCTGKLQVDVRTFASFAATDVTRPLSNGAITWTPQYAPGSGGDLVVMRVIYPMPVATDFLASATSNMTGKKRLLMSTQVFRNEPFGSAT